MSPSRTTPEWEPVHTILLGNNVMGIENLGGDIEKVKGQRFMFCAFPLRWYGRRHHRPRQLHHRRGPYQ